MWKALFAIIDRITILFMRDNVGEKYRMAIPNMWRTKKQRYSLQGEVCLACSSTIFPPRKVCPSCGSTLDPVQEAVAADSALPFNMVFSPIGASGSSTLPVSPAGDD